MCRTICILHDLWNWYPPVGVFIAILAVVSVALPFFRKLEEIGRGEKIAWTLLMLLLMLLEVKSIYQDRTAHDNEQRAARDEQLRQFHETAKGIDDSLKKMERVTDLSSRSLKTSSKALEQITGGGQFCYLMGFPEAPGTVRLSVHNSGPVPLERCFVVIHLDEPIHSAADADRNLQVLVAKELGPVAPWKNQGITTDIVLPYKSYYIQIYTRNDQFYETLTFNSEYPKGGLETIEVRNKLKLLYSQPEKQSTKKVAH